MYFNRSIIMCIRRHTVFSLYRTKIQLCRALGYNFGKWNPGYICNYESLRPKQLARILQREFVGDFIFNNIRYKYKLYRKIDDPVDQSIMIDHGFSVLRFLNDSVLPMVVVKANHKDDNLKQKLLESSNSRLLFLPSKKK